MPDVRKNTPHLPSLKFHIVAGPQDDRLDRYLAMIGKNSTTTIVHGLRPCPQSDRLDRSLALIKRNFQRSNCFWFATSAISQ